VLEDDGPGEEKVSGYKHFQAAAFLLQLGKICGTPNLELTEQVAVKLKKSWRKI
jgi:hypothetical protein